MVESASKLNVTSFVELGENTAEPDASNWRPDVTNAPKLNVARLCTLSVPPRLVAPVPTLNVLVPVTLVAPLRLIAPVPVEKVFVPVCVMLLVNVDTPATLSAPPSVVSPVPPTNRVLPDNTANLAPNCCCYGASTTNLRAIPQLPPTNDSSRPHA